MLIKLCAFYKCPLTLNPACCLAILESKRKIDASLLKLTWLVNRSCGHQISRSMLWLLIAQASELQWDALTFLSAPDPAVTTLGATSVVSMLNAPSLSNIDWSSGHRKLICREGFEIAHKGVILACILPTDKQGPLDFARYSLFILPWYSGRSYMELFGDTKMAWKFTLQGNHLCRLPGAGPNTKDW